jgi:tetratricopeptide (TPR) repeat protein
LALVALSTACAQPAAPPRPRTAAQILAQGRSEGLALVDPLALDDTIKRAADKIVSASDPPEVRLRVLMRYLGSSGHINFEYLTDQSLTAQQAFHQRRGDCMAYTNLFIALSRHLGVRTQFVHVRYVRHYYERNNSFFVSSHVAAGYGHGPNTIIVDFSNQVSNWNLALYEPIDDSKALALYYNNVAVGDMIGGRTETAKQLFEFWLEHVPDVAELHNNYGVLLNRMRRYTEALTVLRSAAERFPTSESLLTNGLWAARGAGRRDLMAEFQQRSQRLEQTDPFFLFALGLGFYESDRYMQAALHLERAREVKPDSPVILAWLTRAYFAAGLRDAGFHAFQQVKALAPPGHKLTRDLESQFPELREKRAD